MSIIKIMIHHQTQKLTIAVTGHRFIPDDINLGQSIRRVLKNLIRTHSGFIFSLLSPLAEGSDQLITQVALDLKQFKLHVPLPMSVEEYLLDFISESGQVAFHKLVSLADKVYSLPSQENHQNAYEVLGHYLVYHSNILLAVWNGAFNHQIGGTSEIVKLALEAHKTIYWVYCPNQKAGECNIIEDQKKIGDLEILSPESS